MVKVEYKWVITSIKWMKDAQRLEWVKPVSLRKDYGFSAKQIKEYEENWKLKPYLVWKTKYYRKDDILKLL